MLAAAGALHERFKIVAFFWLQHGLVLCISFFGCLAYSDWGEYPKINQGMDICVYRARVAGQGSSERNPSNKFLEQKWILIISVSFSSVFVSIFALWQREPPHTGFHPFDPFDPTEEGLL